MEAQFFFGNYYIKIICVDRHIQQLAKMVINKIWKPSPYCSLQGNFFPVHDIQQCISPRTTKFPRLGHHRTLRTTNSSPLFLWWSLLSAINTSTRLTKRHSTRPKLSLGLVWRTVAIDQSSMNPALDTARLYQVAIADTILSRASLQDQTRCLPQSQLPRSIPFSNATPPKALLVVIGDIVAETFTELAILLSLCIFIVCFSNAGQVSSNCVRRYRFEKSRKRHVIIQVKLIPSD